MSIIEYKFDFARPGFSTFLAEQIALSTVSSPRSSFINKLDGTPPHIGVSGLSGSYLLNGDGIVVAKTNLSHHLAAVGVFYGHVHGSLPSDLTTSFQSFSDTAIDNIGRFIGPEAAESFVLGVDDNVMNTMSPTLKVKSLTELHDFLGRDLLKGMDDTLPPPLGVESQSSKKAELELYSEVSLEEEAKKDAQECKKRSEEKIKEGRLMDLYAGSTATGDDMGNDSLLHMHLMNKGVKPENLEAEAAKFKHNARKQKQTLENKRQREREKGWQQGLPAFVVGAIAGGLIYDGAKAAWNSETAKEIYKDIDEWGKRRGEIARRQMAESFSHLNDDDDTEAEK